MLESAPTELSLAMGNRHGLLSAKARQCSWPNHPKHFQSGHPARESELTKHRATWAMSHVQKAEKAMGFLLEYLKLWALKIRKHPHCLLRMAKHWLQKNLRHGIDLLILPNHTFQNLQGRDTV